jgi:hypothetical protein
MTSDPYTLYVALDGSKTAKGSLYMDDEVSFNHESKEEFVMASFTADFSHSSGVIQNSVTAGKGWQAAVEAMANSRIVERILVMGVKNAPTSIDVAGEALGFTHDSHANVLVIRKPGVSAVLGWQIKITY